MNMANNLEERIKISGMSKKEVAAANGVTPETISRQIHGKVELSIKDAEKYAVILECTVQKILFVSEPMPIVCKTHIHADERNERTYAASETGLIYSHDYYDNENCAMYYTVDKKNPEYGLWHGALTFMRRKPIEQNYVDKDCTQKFCLAKVVGCELLIGGVLYPEPEQLYTIHDIRNDNVQKSLNLEWATPILAATFRPELRGMHIVWGGGVT